MVMMQLQLLLHLMLGGKSRHHRWRGRRRISAELMRMSSSKLFLSARSRSTQQGPWHCHCCKLDPAVLADSIRVVSGALLKAAYILFRTIKYIHNKKSHIVSFVISSILYAWTADPSSIPARYILLIYRTFK